MERGRGLPDRFGGGVTMAIVAVGLASILVLSMAGAFAEDVGAVERPGELWPGHVRAVDEALAAGRIDHAATALRDAYIAAFRARGWEGMLAVGDAARRLAATAGVGPGVEPTIRKAYLTGLFRARQHHSVEGILAFADRFAALGDREVVETCIGMAQRITAGDRDEQRRSRVRAFTERFTVIDHSGGLRLEQF